MIKRVFLDHPASVNESYLEHLSVASGFALRLFAAGLAALIHALIPCLFERTTRAEIIKLHQKIKTR